MLDLQGRSLGFLVAAGPAAPGFGYAIRLAAAALAQGCRVQMFCVDEAVRGLPDLRLQALREAGLRLHACAWSGRRHHIEVGSWASPAGLALASALVAHSDRFLAFT